jgi:hypothetical protein
MTRRDPLEVDPETQPIHQHLRRTVFGFEPFVERDHRNSRRPARGDPLTLNADLTRIEHCSQTAGGACAHALGHGYKHNATIRFRQQSPLGHGTPSVQSCRQIQPTQQTGIRDLWRNPSNRGSGAQQFGQGFEPRVANRAGGSTNHHTTQSKWVNR